LCSVFQGRQTREQRLLSEALTNVRNLLNTNGGNNPCANFFGGAALAIAALNSIPFTPGELPDYRTGIQMTVPLDEIGAFLRYIVPTSAIVNTRGSFYQNFATDPVTRQTVRTPAFGGYNANTNRSRALQILHELGHVIVTGANPDGTPRLLLPLDGRNVDPDGTLSAANTRRVLQACRAQINAIRN
jgi:hypothetical protein